MKRIAGIVALAALCALPAAHGDSVHLTTNVLHAMTPIGSTPTKKDIIDIFPQDTVARLTEIAHDNGVDFGVRLRAIRALPEFCLPSCAGTVAYQSLKTLLVSIVPNPQEGTSILLVRATIESIGIAKSGDPDDVGLLVPYLASTSRDIRATTAYALRDLCQPTAIDNLRTAYNVEMVMQVRLAISTALRDLATCTN
jgi:HEAT repeat protein